MMIEVKLDGRGLLIYKGGRKQTGAWARGFCDGVKERIPREWTDKEQGYITRPFRDATVVD